jgi:hypothetical protein
MVTDEINSESSTQFCSGFGQRLVSQHCGSQRAYKRIEEVSDDRIFVQVKHST